ncbi:LysR family transcriptional regulator (plasmid) [Sinorhizobium meliloti]|nr:LysR family transcriptional regulator [Sinorhizobium meliloti]
MGDLSDIRVFLAVAQQRSFTAAARQLSMTPPTVTRAVSALERVLAEWEPPELWLTLYYPPYEKLPMRVARFSDFFERYVTHTRPL